MRSYMNFSKTIKKTCRKMEMYKHPFNIDIMSFAPKWRPTVKQFEWIRIETRVVDEQEVRQVRPKTARLVPPAARAGVLLPPRCRGYLAGWASRTWGTRPTGSHSSSA